jgi:hypothetical protein
MIRVGDALYEGGYDQLQGEYPEYSGYDEVGTMSPSAGSEARAIDGESALYHQQHPMMAPNVFPIHWPRLREALQYFHNTYTDVGYWNIYVSDHIFDSAGWNLPGVNGIYIDREVLHSEDTTAIETLIHEAQHDWYQDGLGHGGVIREIVPCEDNPPTSDLGTDYYLFINFLQSARRAETPRTLWDEIRSQTFFED